MGKSREQLFLILALSYIRINCSLVPIIMVPIIRSLLGVVSPYLRLYGTWGASDPFFLVKGSEKSSGAIFIACYPGDLKGEGMPTWM